MTTNLLSVIEQQHKALEELLSVPNDDSPESVARCILGHTKARKAIAAGQHALEQTQWEAERLPPMPENVLADIQQAHEYVAMWAKGEAYYAPASAYDDMPGKRKATIKDVMKSAKFIAPRLMSASLAMRDYFAAIDAAMSKKGRAQGDTHPQATEPAPINKKL